MKRILLFVSTILFAGTAFSQSGKIIESLSIESEILGKSVEYSVYLPADYDQSTRKYPVLYLLHGYSDDETGWNQFGEVKTIADQMIGEVEVTPMIIAMPDAGLDWYINSYDGKVNYEDFFIQEFIPFIESKYKARGTKEFRAVSGLSMGGHGTLIYALKHPDMFASAAPLSAAVWDREEFVAMDQDAYERFFGFIFGDKLSGEARATEHMKENAPLHIVKFGDAEELKKVKWYIDCGDDDFLINGNMDLHKAMTEQKIPHEFRVRDGAHNWTYWRTALPEVLKFVSESFHR